MEDLDMQRLTHQSSLARILHFDLYNRILNFVKTISRDIARPDGITRHWLNRLYSGDETIHVLAEVNVDFKITAHAIIEIQFFMGEAIVVCHQLQDDLKHGKSVEYVNVYMNELMIEVNAVSCCIVVEKGQKAYKEKYGFELGRTIMYKKGPAFPIGEDESEGE